MLDSNQSAALRLALGALCTLLVNLITKKKLTNKKNYKYERVGVQNFKVSFGSEFPDEGEGGWSMDLISSIDEPDL